MKSDCNFVKAVYEFSPDKMNHWIYKRASESRRVPLDLEVNRRLQRVDSDIFYIRNQGYLGFQQGDCRVRQGRITVDLYSDDGGIEMNLFQKDYRDSGGVTQPEINRIIQSLHKARQLATAASPVAKE
jgi:hypothetical protein